MSRKKNQWHLPIKTSRALAERQNTEDFFFFFFLYYFSRIMFVPKAFFFFFFCHCSSVTNGGTTVLIDYTYVTYDSYEAPALRVTERFIPLCNYRCDFRYFHTIMISNTDKFDALITMFFFLLSRQNSGTAAAVKNQRVTNVIAVFLFFKYYFIRFSYFSFWKKNIIHITWYGIQIECLTILMN